MNRGETMYFPDTVDEFMEEYKMVDTKEIYSNGIEYVPIFRMKQWFEHSTVTKADICIEFGNWYFSRIKLPEEEREKFTNEWNDLVRDYIAEMG